MKRFSTLCLFSLLFLFLLILGVGCQQLPVEVPDSTTPSVSPEPSTTPSEPTPETTPETPLTTPDPEKTESCIQGCAFIKFDGIDGETQVKDHEGWSEIVSFSQDIHKPSAGTGATRRIGDVVLEDIVIVKQLDKASPKLAEAMCKGTVFVEVEIHLTGPSEGSTCEGTFYSYVLKNVQITRYKVTGSNPLAHALITPAPDSILPYSGPFIVQAVDAPLEEISLNFEEITVTYTECDPITGKTKGNVEYTWKVEEGEA